jgi:uncharacterized glyoxalase superfamily protein PhnB
MASKLKPIPDGHHAVTPYLMIAGAEQAIAFYKKAFGAVEVCRMVGPGGHGIAHAELKFGDSFLFLADVCPDFGGKDPKALGGSPVGIHLYVESVDAVFAQAIAAGATVKVPPTDMFWGDRFAKLTDPFGHDWSLATHIEDVSEAEVARRAEAAFAQHAEKQAELSASAK